MGTTIPKKLTLNLSPWQLATLRAMVGAHRAVTISDMETGLHLRADMIRLAPEDIQRLKYEERENGVATWDPACKDERISVTVQGRPAVRLLQTVIDNGIKQGVFSVDEWARHGRDLAGQLGLSLAAPADDADKEDEVVDAERTEAAPVAG